MDDLDVRENGEIKESEVYAANIRPDMTLKKWYHNVGDYSQGFDGGMSEYKKQMVKQLKRWQPAPPLYRHKKAITDWQPVEMNQ